MGKNKKVFRIGLMFLVALVVVFGAYYFTLGTVSAFTLTPSCSSNNNVVAANLIASGYVTSASQNNIFVLAPNMIGTIAGPNSVVFSSSALFKPKPATLVCGCPSTCTSTCKIHEDEDEQGNPLYSCTGGCTGDFCDSGCVVKLNNPNPTSVAYTDTQVISLQVANTGFTVNSSVSGRNGAKGTIKSIKTILGKTILYITPTNTTPFIQGDTITQTNGIKATIALNTIAINTTVPPAQKQVEKFSTKPGTYTCFGGADGKNTGTETDCEIGDGSPENPGSLCAGTGKDNLPFTGHYIEKEIDGKTVYGCSDASGTIYIGSGNSGDVSVISFQLPSPTYAKTFALGTIVKQSNGAVGKVTKVGLASITISLTSNVAFTANKTIYTVTTSNIVKNTGLKAATVVKTTTATTGKLLQ